MSELLLKMENIRKTFPGVIALDNVNMDLCRGEVHAIVGENGAGKSTLMKILSGIYQPDKGSLLYKGSPVTLGGPNDAQNRGICIIHQELNLAPHLTVAQNIFLGREPLLYGRVLDERRLNRMAAAILEQLHLDIKPTTIVSELGVSKQQMVEIAKALSVKSEVLIMDEPTSALSEAEIAELFQTIHRLKQEGVGIFYISHRLEELQQIVDRISVLRDGHFIGTWEYGQLTLDEIIAKMVGRPLHDKFPQRQLEIGETIFEVKNITRKGILKNISFQLRKGEVLGIAGLMGAGRTELARAIFGADPKDGGQILLEGRELSVTNPVAAIKEGIAYLSEDRKRDGLALKLQVDENITLANVPLVSNACGVLSRQKEQEIAAKFVNDLHIKTPSLTQLAVNLSGGNQQKIVIAKWLCRNSKVIIFDEPTRGIDVGAKYEVYELINALAAQGVGIIMISSELPEILGMSDRIIVLHEGRITGQLNRSEACQERILNLATGLENQNKEGMGA
ncbi:monosaccharide ABC transporter ATP-binding protein (CUT2 family) [Hydrogenispora ethanolica]|uniref:Monosaccharide ABC transporter ATP-binding protein (CUT2 family) n=1 Tax=Hydrogenispora ethanolica TaxID=1082276 RepID=A0A4V2QGK9_HYDET|nr:sugar ABC transporter ATP-binding protein [Hydrogenispora ethanolica]TCL76287.1 monosaccharide ABC transporter ATP-binding protein (CUT2 family) [Hydrogenispora ethanolica]